MLAARWRMWLGHNRVMLQWSRRWHGLREEAATRIQVRCRGVGWANMVFQHNDTRIVCARREILIYMCARSSCDLCFYMPLNDKHTMDIITCRPSIAASALLSVTCG